MSSPTERLESTLDRKALATLQDPNGAGSWPLVVPASDDEWQDFIQLARAERWRILPLGHATKLGWTRSPDHVDVYCSTARTTGVVAHEPADGTITVRAGTSMTELERIVTTGGHSLVPDVPRGLDEGSGPTIGGVVAAGQSGWDRLRHGPVRHQVLGTTILSGSGERSRSGGALVKNVTGYDLHRLHAGSFGTLGILLEISLRLVPAPEESVWCEQRCPSAGSAFATAAVLRALSVTPTAIAVHGDGQGWRLGVHLAGSQRAVAAERDRVVTALGGGTAELSGTAALERSAQWRESETSGGWPDLFVTVQPSDCEAALDGLTQSAARADLELRVLAHPGVATVAIHAEGSEEARDDWLIENVPELRRSLESRGGRAFLRRATPRVLTAVEPFGAPVGLGLMRTLRSQLDPEARFATGRLSAEL